MQHKDFAYDTVLIVDDDPIVNLVHRKIIEKAHTTPDVRSFTDPREALADLHGELAGFEKGILVLLDINMPEMSGFEFLDSVSLFQRNGNLIEVVIVSSSIAESDMEKGLKNDLVTGYVTKPLSGPKILDLVKGRSPMSA